MGSGSEKFHRLISYPVYIFYWVVGLSAAATIALGYFNADHEGPFYNILQPIVSDPKAMAAYEHRYTIVFVCLFFWALKYFLQLRHERSMWRSVLLEIAEISNRFDRLEQFLGSKRVITETMVDYINSELTRIANCTCNILDEFTGQNCHVAIPRPRWRD